jgi:hypothetical protein
VGVRSFRGNAAAATGNRGRAVRLERFGALRSPEEKGDGDHLRTNAPPITATRGSAAPRDLGSVGTAQGGSLVQHADRGVVELLTAGDAALITMVAAARIDEKALRDIFVKSSTSAARPLARRRSRCSRKTSF